MSICPCCGGSNSARDEVAASAIEHASMASGATGASSDGDALPFDRAMRDCWQIAHDYAAGNGQATVEIANLAATLAVSDIGRAAFRAVGLSADQVDLAARTALAEQIASGPRLGDGQAPAVSRDVAVIFARADVMARVRGGDAITVEDMVDALRHRSDDLRSARFVSEGAVRGGPEARGTPNETQSDAHSMIRGAARVGGTHGHPRERLFERRSRAAASWSRDPFQLRVGLTDAADGWLDRNSRAPDTAAARPARDRAGDQATRDRMRAATDDSNFAAKVLESLRVMRHEIGQLREMQARLQDDFDGHRNTLDRDGRAGDAAGMRDHAADSTRLWQELAALREALVTLDERMARSGNADPGGIIAGDDRLDRILDRLTALEAEMARSATGPTRQAADDAGRSQSQSQSAASSSSRSRRRSHGRRSLSDMSRWRRRRQKRAGRSRNGERARTPTAGPGHSDLGPGNGENGHATQHNQRDGDARTRAARDAWGYGARSLSDHDHVRETNDNTRNSERGDRTRIEDDRRPGQRAADAHPAFDADEDDPATKRFYLAIEDDVVCAPSIGPRTASRLYPHGVHTVADLLKADPADLAERIESRYITTQTIEDWQMQARLVCTIPWLRGTHAQLLVGSGYTNAADIADAGGERLSADILKFSTTRDGQRILRNGPPPAVEKIDKWAEFAALAELDRVA